MIDMVSKVPVKMYLFDTWNSPMHAATCSYSVPRSDVTLVLNLGGGGISFRVKIFIYPAKNPNDLF